MNTPITVTTQKRNKSGDSSVLTEAVEGPSTAEMMKDFMKQQEKNRAEDKKEAREKEEREVARARFKEERAERMDLKTLTDLKKEMKEQIDEESDEDVRAECKAKMKEIKRKIRGLVG